ncbi:hypothetical protein KSB_24250 [Ktedonobacter robiniae]|uniref:Uncharacterized protein n=1 Tax=Ktedonobacter robiniae TaxID=2778365 RepID=A0ABQ3UNK8_9CHLR|nr:hypothetical protein KSB_24250 [Ktedonobacter robiniae]
MHVSCRRQLTCTTPSTPGEHRRCEKSRLAPEQESKGADARDPQAEPAGKPLMEICQIDSSRERGAEEETPGQTSNTAPPVLIAAPLRWRALRKRLLLPGRFASLTST